MSELQDDGKINVRFRIDERDGELIKDLLDTKKDKYGEPLYSSVSHFCKCAMKRLLRESRGGRYW